MDRPGSGLRDQYNCSGSGLTPGPESGHHRESPLVSPGTLSSVPGELLVPEADPAAARFSVTSTIVRIFFAVPVGCGFVPNDTFFIFLFFLLLTGIAMIAIYNK